MTDDPPTDLSSRTLLFGAAYYAEYRPSRTADEDLDLMKEAGLTVIRVGESVWSTWQPRQDRFDVEWLRPVLDGAHRRGIGVILGTPTYAIPPWLQVLHPELAGQTATGVRKPWGSRQEVNYASPTFRGFAERVIRKVLETYASHPAVIGYQVDNEPGLILFHNDDVFQSFKEKLASKYGSVDNLNEAWGLTYWSHRLTSFDELWRPDGNSFPQYELAWRQFQADLTTEFIQWQVSLVREYSTPNQFVTTCIAYPRPAQHDGEVAAVLDVVAGNPYYDMQDGLDLVAGPTDPARFAVSGVGKFFRQADRMWSGRRERFLVTETNAQSIGDHSYNLTPYPGQLKQAAYGLVSRGARMVMYWNWQTLHYGFETFWGGILPHSRKPGRIYREISEIGRSFARVGPALEGFVPDSDVVLVYSNVSKWAFEFSGPVRTAGGEADPQSYERIFDAFHSGIVESSRQALIVQDIHILNEDPGEFAAEHPVLVVPALYIASREILGWLHEYAIRGGHLVLGIRTGYADLEAWAREEVAPPGLSETAGVTYEEYTNLAATVPVIAHTGLRLSAGAGATGWADGLVVSDATVVASYQHRELGRFPAITTRAAGSGRATYVGTVPNRPLARDIARWLVPNPLASGWQASPEGCVIVQSGLGQRGRVSFIFNWSGDEAKLTAPMTSTDLETGQEIAGECMFAIEPRGVRILLEKSGH